MLLSRSSMSKSSPSSIIVEVLLKYCRRKSSLTSAEIFIQEKIAAFMILKRSGLRPCCRGCSVPQTVIGGFSSHSRVSGVDDFLNIQCCHILRDDIDTMPSLAQEESGEMSQINWRHGGRTIGERVCQWSAGEWKECVHLYSGARGAIRAHATLHQRHPEDALSSRRDSVSHHGHRRRRGA